MAIQRGIRNRTREAGFLARASRTARTALAVGVYGFAGLALALVVFPLQRLEARLTGRDEPADLRAQRTIHRASRGFLHLAEFLRLVRVRWRNTEALRRGPCLVVANHPSLLDTPVLHACMPQADFIVAPGWSDNPFLRRTAEAAGYLRADRGAQVVRDAAERLRAGRTVVFYPEGSRTPAGGLRRFQRGAAHAALEAGCDLVPVLIQVSPRILMKEQPWNEVPERTPEWHVEVGEPIRPAVHLDGSEPRPLAARRLTAILEDYFGKRWDRGDA